MWLKTDTLKPGTRKPLLPARGAGRDQFQSSTVAKTRRQKFKLESLKRGRSQRDRPEADAAELPDTTRQCPDGNIDAGLILLDPLCLLVAGIAHC